MENKDIDRLFNEKLKNLEATPTKRVWNNIESNLKKRKRRVLPIWWFSGGTAAALILGFLLFPFSNKPLDKINDTPIITANPEIDSLDLNNIKTKSIFKQINNEVIVAEETKVSKEKENTNKINSKETVFLVTDKLRKSVAKVTDNKAVNNTKEEKHLIDNGVIGETIEAIKNKTIIANEDVLIKTEKPSDSTKKIDLIDKNKTKYLKKDILVVLSNIKEEEKKSNKKLWTVSPVVAVLNSNSFSNGSPINKNLGNSIRGDNSYSYGVKVGYQLDNKWTIQSGIHLQEIQFSNNQIIVNETSSSISNIAFNSGISYSLEDSSLDNLSLNTISQNANLSQVYGYIEIPIEIKYNIIENRKFKTELVAGFSSLFLNKNTVNLTANSLTKTGKVDNLNSFNFSGNLGVDFKYQFDKKWSLNLNPMFKTQLNTFNNDTNGFKPYFIGIYTGINYQF
jgi:hypothetical protein